MDNSLTVNEILKYLEIKQATLSSHLAILRKSGLVNFEIKGKLRIYKLNKDVLKSFVIELNRFIDIKEVENGFKTENEIIVRRKND
jgi:DNA-binding transcriptional ArsR family regulator